MNDKELVNLARKAMTNSYSPYSRFQVGAALLTRSGKVFTGCNIENASLGLSVCAERTAVFTAVSHGEKRFSAIAVVNATGKAVSPCGACRQVIKEFSKDLKVILSGSRGRVRKFSIARLLPKAFESRTLTIGKKTAKKKSSG